MMTPNHTFAQLLCSYYVRTRIVLSTIESILTESQLFLLCSLADVLCKRAVLRRTQVMLM